MQLKSVIGFIQQDSETDLSESITAHFDPMKILQNTHKFFI